MSMFFNSLVVHFQILAGCINTDTVYMSITNILFLPLNFDFKSYFILLLYSLKNFSFMSVSYILSISTIPIYLYPFSSIHFIICPFGSTKPFSFTTFPLFSTSTLHFLTRNSILIPSLKKCTVCSIESIFLILGK